MSTIVRTAVLKLRLAGVVATLAALAACAGLPSEAPSSPQDLSWVTAGAGLLPAADPGVAGGADSLLHVTDEMRAFAVAAVDQRPFLQERSAALAHALSSVHGLNLQYDAEATLSAEEAFRQKRANCLTYTILFIALAREVGIPAKFNNVDIPPVWDVGDDSTVLRYRHINARIDLGGTFYQVVDISGDEYNPDIYAQFAISDEDAEAQFYNNRAVQLRLAHRPIEALRYQLRALQLSPQAAFLWTNLADLYLAQGQPRAARIAVSRSLELDSTDAMAYETAAQTYDKLGQKGVAKAFHARARDFMEQNPYYHYHLALAAMHEGDDQSAYSEIREAARTQIRDPRIYFVMAVLLDRMGKTQDAESSMSVVMQLTDGTRQQERYRSKFARLKEQQS